jgi:UDP-N-acetylglucosamine 3-dehydrogenase
MTGRTSTKREVRIGILGSGWMGSVHATCYQQIEGVKIVGIFSRNKERAATIAGQCGAKAVSDASALLEDPTIDALDVCVPSAIHQQIVSAALQHGKHVFSETPFALCLEAAEAMSEAAKRSGPNFDGWSTRTLDCSI